MPYFSLLPSSRLDDGDYDVQQCHINVWSLPGFFGHRPMLIDIGLLLESAGSPTVKAVEMVVPARVVKQLDLSHEVSDSKNARLIFGRHFLRAGPNGLELEGLGLVPVVGVKRIEQRSKLERLTDESDRELTALRVELGTMPDRGPAYVRVRFVIDGTAGMWRWHRVLLRRSGAIIDFRVHDPREGGFERTSRAQLEGRDKPIPRLDAFFMLPERFQLTGQNPDLTYTRTLEGVRWKDYLRRSPSGLIRRESILVHRWRRHESEDGPGVHDDRPFRGYLQFQRVPNLRPISDTLLTAAVTALLLYALFRPLELRSAPGDLTNSAGELLEHEIAAGVSSLAAATIVGTVIAVLALLAKLGKVPNVLRRAKRAFKEVEFWWFKHLGR